MNISQQEKINISQQEAQEIEAVYNDLLERVKKVFSKGQSRQPNAAITDIVNFVIEKLSCLGGLLLLYTGKNFDKDYIFAHCLNVCLISVRVGMRLQLNRERLVFLGFLGLSHLKKDIGPPRQLLGNAEDVKEAKEIVALADIYDALTHPPAYRHEITPYDTLTSIINSDKFERKLIRIFLEELSLYPTGSWVELSNHEIGKVIGINKAYLLRPIVSVFISPEGKYLRKTKSLDLSKNMLIYVLRPLSEEEIKHMRKE